MYFFVLGTILLATQALHTELCIFYFEVTLAKLPRLLQLKILLPQPPRVLMLQVCATTLYYLVSCRKD